jgi:hypothetical protein
MLGFALNPGGRIKRRTGVYPDSGASLVGEGVYNEYPTPTEMAISAVFPLQVACPLEPLESLNDI